MSAFADLVRFTPTLGGTTDWVVSSAVGGCQTPALANVLNGVSYKVYAVSTDLTQWEISTGAYNSGTTTFPRTTVLYNSSGTGTATGQSGAGTKINFSTVPQVSLVALAEDLVSVDTMIFPPQGRVTLTSGVPVMSTTVSAQTTVFYTPYVGQIVPIYDGTTMRPTVFSELSQATTDTTKSPAAVAASKVYDIFVWNDAGTLRATRGPAWANDTTRGYTLTLTNGIYLNTSTITNGPAALRGTWVGTIRSNASSQIDFIFGSGAAAGGQAFFGVCNLYNRVNVSTTVVDTNTTWATATSATPATLDASTTNRISAVMCVADDGIYISLATRVITAAVLNASGSVGFGMDVTSTTYDKRFLIGAISNFAGNSPGVASNTYNVAGFHFWQAMQAGDGTNAATIVGGNSSAPEMAFTAQLRM